LTKLWSPESGVFLGHSVEWHRKESLMSDITKTDDGLVIFGDCWSPYWLF